MSPWWKRVTDPTPDPTLDRGARQRLMVATAPPVVPPQSPHAELAGWRLRAEEAEKALFAESLAHRDTLALVERLRSTPTPEDFWMEVRVSDEGQRARKFARMYGRASATIGQQRGQLARLRERLQLEEQLLSAVSVALGCGSDPVTDHLLDVADLAGKALVTSTFRRELLDSTVEAVPADPADTRAVHHEGRHVATAGGQVLNVWPNDADRRPCAKCTDRVHALSARGWCDWCESCAVQDGDEELVEKARVLGDEIGQRIVTGAEARDMPVGTVLLREDGRDPVPAVLKIEGGWWSTESRVAEPLAGELRFAVLYVPGTAETREVRPAVGQRDRTAAIEGAAITLRAHGWSRYYSMNAHPETRCTCGWSERNGGDHSRHVAEQLAAVGALGNHAATPPDLIDADGDTWVPDRVEWVYRCNPRFGDYGLGDLPLRDSESRVRLAYGPVTEKAGA